MRDAHDTHCCIDHGCKYCDPNCPVKNGIRKQVYLCENCGLETEGYYGEPERTRNEQQEYVDALWEKKQNPNSIKLTPYEEKIAKIIEEYGRSKVLGILNSIVNSKIPIELALEITKNLKWLK